MPDPSYANPSYATISAPIANSTVRVPALSVIGSAQAGSQVHLFLNGAIAANLIDVGSSSGSGSFAGTINLQTEGSNTITANAKNTRGTSPTV